MRSMITVVESAPVPVALHDGFSLKAMSGSFKSLLGIEDSAHFEQRLKRCFSAGENFNRLLEGVALKKAVQSDLTSYSKGSKLKWKAHSTPVNAGNESFQITWLVDHTHADIETSYWALHVKMNKSTSELIMNRKKLEDSMLSLQKTHEELQEAQMKLLHSEKLASIGQLAAGVAHEINNPVGFINNNMEVLQRYIEDYDKILKMAEALKGAVEEGRLESAQGIAKEMAQFEEDINFDYITGDMANLLMHTQRGLERIRKIVLDLRTFAREEKDAMEMIRIEEVIDSVLSIVQNELKYKADLKKSYGKTPLIKCNTQRMGQVFINLLVNAAQAIEEKGSIEIRTYVDKDHVCVDIADTGKGISAEHLKKIFDPFFTTKPVGEGTGLGLSVSYEIVKNNGGVIEVASEEGKGTTFSVRLPLTTDELNSP